MDGIADEPPRSRRLPGRTGRPRDGSKNAQILAITLDALAERGYDQLTVDAIADQAGTAKTTIYRRWPTKTDLLAAAIVTAGGPPEADALPDRGSLRADLIAFIDSPWLGGPNRRLRIFANLASAARTSGELADLIQAQVTDPYVRAYRALFDRAADRGLIPAEVRRRIPVVAQVIPALSSQQIASRTPRDRDYYVEILDDVVLPALSADRTGDGT